MEMDQTQLKSEYRLEGADKTLKIGRLLSIIAILGIAYFTLQDIYIVDFKGTLPFRLIMISAGFLFLLYSYTLGRRHKKYAVLIYSLTLTILILGMVGVTFVAYFPPNNTLFHKVGTSVGLIVVLFGTYVFSGQAIKYLVYIFLLAAIVLLIGLVTGPAMSKVDWALFSNPLIVTVMIILLAFFQERANFQEFKMRKLALFREKELEQKTAEMQQLNEQLAHELSDRKLAEAALRISKMEAVSANLAKSQFVATMSHEIRTPLNAVIGLTYLLAETGLTAKQLHYVETIQTSGEVLLSIVNNILDFSKIEAGKIEIEAMVFNLKALLDDFHQMMVVKAEKKGLTLAVSIADGVPANLKGDPGRLQQVLINLGDNAIKFSPQGQIRLQAFLEEDFGNEVLLRFSIKDSGIGIPKDKQGLIFESFQQVDAGITRKFGGTGLGLAISKKLAELMGGTIGVVSQKGQGSEFWFTARFAKGEVKSESPSLQTAGAERKMAAVGDVSHRTERILLAEDNIINQQVAALLIRKLGFQVNTVANGEESIAALKLIPYDLVLMDLQMPEMDGITATQAIRSGLAGEALKEIPIIALTAHTTQEDRQQCIQAGMNDYIPKPVTPHKLAEVIERWLPPKGK